MPTFGFSAFLKMLSLSDRRQRSEMRARLSPSDGGYDFHRGFRRLAHRYLTEGDDLAVLLSEASAFTNPAEGRSAVAALKYLRDWREAHIDTLRDASSGRVSFRDIFTFFLVPLGVSVGAYFFKITIGAVAVGILVSALSILAGLLINVLVLLYTINAVGPTQTEIDEQMDLIKEVNANLLYEITISIFAVVLLCFLPTLRGVYSLSISAVVIFILGNFSLTLLMALKRIKVLIGLRFK